MAGLRFTRTAGQTSTPLETRSGSYIYNGDPAYFHDWEFRTLMRLKLYEDAIKAKAQKKASRRNSRRSPTSQDEPTDADAEVEAPGEEPEGGGDLASLAAAMSRESPSDTSRSSKHGKSSKPAGRAMVPRIYLREMTLMNCQHLQPKPELRWCRRC